MLKGWREWLYFFMLWAFAFFILLDIGKQQYWWCVVDALLMLMYAAGLDGLVKKRKAAKVKRAAP